MPGCAAHDAAPTSLTPRYGARRGRTPAGRIGDPPPRRLRAVGRRATPEEIGMEATAPGPAAWVLEIREPTGAARRVEVRGQLEVGRDCDGIVLDDPLVSRRHLCVEPATDGVLVADLGSANGTTVDGADLDAPAVVAPGRLVRLGDSELSVHAVPAAAGPQAAAEGGSTGPPAIPSTGGHQWEEIDASSALIRFRPGSAGAELARDAARDARRARGRLEELAPAGWRPTIHLVDPFPDPDDPALTVASGTLVDTAAGTLWMVVTPEAPPEPLERPMALLLTTQLPAGQDLAVLLEGYGLHLAGAGDPDEQLRSIPLPTLAEATGELRSAMTVSFVRSLIEGQSEAAFVELLTSSAAGRIDETAR